jgi:hypothetical protein
MTNRDTIAAKWAALRPADAEPSAAELAEVEAAEMLDEVNAQHDAGLTMADAQLTADGWTLDGMSIVEWADAMYGDDFDAPAEPEATYTVNEDGATDLRSARVMSFDGRQVTATTRGGNASVFVGLRLHHDGPMPAGMVGGSAEFYAWVRKVATDGENADRGEPAEVAAFRREVSRRLSGDQLAAAVASYAADYARHGRPGPAELVDQLGAKWSPDLDAYAAGQLDAGSLRCALCGSAPCVCPPFGTPEYLALLDRVHGTGGAR